MATTPCGRCAAATDRNHAATVVCLTAHVATCSFADNLYGPQLHMGASPVQSTPRE